MTDPAVKNLLARIARSPRSIRAATLCAPVGILLCYSAYSALTQESSTETHRQSNTLPMRSRSQFVKLAPPSRSPSFVPLPRIINEPENEPRESEEFAPPILSPVTDIIPASTDANSITANPEVLANSLESQPNVKDTPVHLAIFAAQAEPRYRPLPAFNPAPVISTTTPTVNAASELLPDSGFTTNSTSGLLQSPGPQPPTKDSASVVSGSDVPKPLLATEWIVNLDQPISPLDCVRGIDARVTHPEIFAGELKGKLLRNPESTVASNPDPRFLDTWDPKAVAWASPAFCYQPLYFEHVNLERYGIGYPCPLNALASGTKFFVDASLLPIAMIKHHPKSCECTLGHLRPGNCTPLQRVYR